MFAKIQWRVTFLFILISTLTLLLLGYFLDRNNCAASVNCLQSAIIFASIALILSSIVVGYIVSERTAKPLRQLTKTANRIANGDINARVLPRTRDEVGEFNRAFNRMTERLGEELQGLKEEQSQLATAVNYLADGVIITDERGYVQLLNPAAATMLEAEPDKSIGRSFAEVARHHQLIGLLHQCQAEKAEQTAAIEIGRELFLQTIVTPFREAGSLGYLVVLQNLTPIRRLQTVRRDFISNISHELRTPLASLRAVVETLQDHALDDRDIALRFLGRAETEIDVMTQMVEELLELSRIESGQVPLRLEHTPISALILSPVERIREMANREKIKIVVDIPAKIPIVLADSKRVHQVVSNLLHNAIKFTEEGGQIKITAFTKSKRFPGQVVISVEDNGVGIAPEDVPRIFERFYKSDRARTRQRGGTGLGLAISRHIVNAHNGYIWVKSKEKKGSTFFFSLPQANTAVYQKPHRPVELMSDL